MLTTKAYEFWFVTGSQLLYGEDVLRQVEENSKTIVNGLDDNPQVPYKLVFKSVLKDSESIRQLESSFQLLDLKMVEPSIIL